MQGVSSKFCYCVTYVKQIWLVFFYTWEFMNDLVYRLNFEYGHSKDSLFLVYNTTGDIYIFINCILILCVLSSFMSICYIKADVVLYTSLLINFRVFFYQLFVSCILVILFQMFVLNRYTGISRGVLQLRSCGHSAFSSLFLWTRHLLWFSRLCRLKRK